MANGPCSTTSRGRIDERRKPDTRARRSPPKHLYKYRSFSARTIDSLLSDKIFYAPPESFNDPLDTKPSLHIDSDIEELAEILKCMIQQRVQAEMQAAAQTIKYRGPKTIEHIKNHSLGKAQRKLSDAAYYATDPDYGLPQDEAHRNILTQHIRTELMAQYGNGVFSLARRCICPLMWSHYGDEHKGLCIGYSIPDQVKEGLHKVNYGGARLIATSRIAAMLRGDKNARQEVNAAVFLKKAADWRYEKEWRHLGPRGSAASPFELADITFGLRCPDSVKHAVMRAFEGRELGLRFYEIHETSANFSLKRHRVHVDDFENMYPKRALDDWDISDAFDIVPDDASEKKE